MKEFSEIKLVRDPHDPRKEKLVGINGQRTIDDHIATAVHVSRRLFPHVVEHITSNRLRSHVSPRDMMVTDRHQTMANVRDELLMAIEGVDRRAQAEALAFEIGRFAAPEALTPQDQQVGNLINNVDPPKRLFF